jgi:NtrC-family two-component system response regulator AlgB
MRTRLDVLVVDDDPAIAATLSVGLRSLGCDVRTAPGAKEALAALEGRFAELILTDMRMEGESGIDLIREVRARNPHALCVVMTAFASFDNAVSSIKAGAFDYLPKPFSMEQLEHLLAKVETIVELRRENERLRAGLVEGDWFEGLSAPSALALQPFIERIAPTEATVLLTGETGTGKTALARSIHRRSARAGKPFVEVVCTALAESLFESEVFGHVRGAFTGAVRDHVGKFEAAHGGTLFLDEIGELSASAQAKLLRFLEDRVIERVGDNSPLRLDVRIIAATNRDLSQMCRDGSFREDLYYRLNVFECRIPPLRERPEDVPGLAVRFFRAATARLGGENPVVEMPAAFLHALQTHSWPGNVRELRNVMERAALLSLGRAPTVSDLPSSVQPSGIAKLPAVNEGHILTLRDVEAEHIRRVLAVEPNQARAAEILGITTVTLWRKRKEYNIGKE